MLKVGDLARREDRRVKGVKIGKTRRDRGISHVCRTKKLYFSAFIEDQFINFRPMNYSRPKKKCSQPSNIAHLSLASQPLKRKDHTQWIILTSGISTLTKFQVVGRPTPMFSDLQLLPIYKWCKTKEKRHIVRGHDFAHFLSFS